MPNLANKAGPDLDENFFSTRAFSLGIERLIFASIGSRQVMLNPDFVSALLPASIAGAGLVLAFYALIVAMSRGIFTRRAVTGRDELEELKKRTSEIGPAASKEEYQELKDKIERIEIGLEFPEYLDWPVAAAFCGYMLSAIFCVCWFLDYQKATMEGLLQLAFVISTMLFLLEGLVGILDIRRTMKSQFEGFKKELEEAKRKTGTYA